MRGTMRRISSYYLSLLILLFSASESSEAEFVSNAFVKNSTLHIMLAKPQCQTHFDDDLSL